jgi:hypothetical protein
MSERALLLRIVSGITTCASEPGEFCRFVGDTHMGSRYVCMLFPGNEGHAHTPLKEKNGWILRCEACLKAEGRA